MSDHTYPIMDALRSALENLNDPDWGTNHLLGVDSEVVNDYLVAVGGPTRWFRVVSYPESDGGGVKRVEYHDSWSSGVERRWRSAPRSGSTGSSVTLDDDEAQQLLDVLGLDWG